MIFCSAPDLPLINSRPRRKRWGLDMRVASVNKWPLPLKAQYISSSKWESQLAVCFVNSIVAELDKWISNLIGWDKTPEEMVRNVFALMSLLDIKVVICLEKMK